MAELTFAAYLVACGTQYPNAPDANPVEVECSDDGDCATGRSCSPLGACIPGGDGGVAPVDGGGGGDADEPVVGDGTGGLGEHCRNSTDCRDFLLCNDGLTCQPSSGADDGEPCELTANCGDGLYCSYGRSCGPAGEGGLHTPCDTTADCQPGLVCLVGGLVAQCMAPGEGDLTDSCAVSADCQAGLHCLSGLGSSRSCGSPLASSVDEPTPRTPAWSGVSCGAEDTVARAYFEVPQGDGVDGDFFRLPFPNDFWRSPAGHLNLSTFPFPEEESEGGKPSHFVETYLQELEREVDGFSRSPVTYFRFSAPPSFASIKEEGAITYVNVTVGSPSFGQRIGPSWYVVQGRTSRYMCGNWLAVRPQLAGPLNAGDTYAVLLGGVITTVGGDSFERSTDMTAMLSATTPEDPELAAAYEAYAPLREWLVQTGTSADSVLNAAVFTVQSESDLVPQLRQVVRDQAVPTVSDLTLCDDGVESPCSQGEGERECATAHGSFAEIHGRISLPIFREGTAPYLRPVDGGDIARDVDGVPTVVRQEDVCFALTVPREAAPLPEGYPLVVYAHGTGGSFRSAIANGLAEDWATNQQDSSPWPVATLAIDLPQHGPRRGDSNLAPDGLFFNYSNPGAVRGNILQGTADLYSLLYWAQNLNWAAGESPTGEALQLAPDAIALFAHSQGATHAALALPWEPALQAVVLSGMGGNLTQSLLHKTNPLNIAGFLPIALRDADENGLLHGGSTHPALTVLQTYFDIVDPRNYAPLVHPDAGAGRPGRHLLMTYGLNDSYSPEKTQQAYAAAAGLPIVEPLLTVQLVDGEEVPNSFGLPTRPAPLGLNVPSGVPLWTTGLRQYQPNDGEDGHFVAFDTTAGRADTQQFLGQALAGEEPLIGP